MKQGTALLALVALCAASLTGRAAAAQQPAQPAAAPPDTEIYLAPLRLASGRIEVGSPINVSNSAGYDNQPFFTPDGRSILFTSVRGRLPDSLGGSTTQTDIYRYDIASRTVSRVTQTPESEYSPTVMPDGSSMSVIRVESDGTQRLWKIVPSGSKIEATVILPAIKPVGYHAWVDDHTLALFVLGQPPTLQLADTRSGSANAVASDIGRSLQRIPGTRPQQISFVQHERTAQVTRLLIKSIDPSTGEIALLTPAVEGSTEADLAWTPDGTLLMVKGAKLYSWRAKQTSWIEVVDLEQLSLHTVTRLSVSGDGSYLALVAAPR